MEILVNNVWRTSVMELIENRNYDEERALYNIKDTEVKNCTFAGPADGESVLKETRNIVVDNCKFSLRYPIWHAKNVTVRDSVVKGEYLAWFSDGLTLINCKIIGTQPLCYCKNLKLINCETEDCDLAFEYSDVEADIVGGIVSVKNPKSGVIRVDSVGEVIFEDSVMDVEGKVVVREKL